MAVEYEISSDVATIKGEAPNTQVARVVSLYSGQITYDDEAGSKFATATIDGKSQRVMLCIAVNGTVNYDDVPSLYSTVDGHRCLNIVAPTETGTPDDVPSLYETVVIDGMNVRAVRCILINATPVYDGVSSVCTFTGDDGKTHTAQLVNKISGGAIEIIVKGISPISLPDAIADSLEYLKAFGGTEQRNIPAEYTQVNYIYCSDGKSYFDSDRKATEKTKIELDIYCTENGANVNRLCGNYLNASKSFTINSANGANTSRFGDASAIIPETMFQANTRYKISSGSDGVFLNGNKVYDWGTVSSFTTDGNVSLLASSNTNTVPTTMSNGVVGYVYSIKWWEDGELIQDWIPCRKGAEAGFYDRINDVFKTSLGATAFVADGNTVPTPDAPMDIVSNNGVIKYGQYGDDLFTTEDAVYGYYINASGEPKANNACFYTKLIPVTKGQSYIFSGKALSGGTGRRIHAYANGEWLEQLAYAVPAENEEFALQFTIPQSADAIRISLVRDDVDVQLKTFGIYADSKSKNLFDGQWQAGIYSTISGEYNPAATNRICNVNMIQVKPSTTYTVSCPDYALALGMKWLFYDANKNFISAITAGSTTITTPSDAKYINFYIANDLTVATAPDLQIEQGSTATAYEPYWNTTETINVHGKNLYNSATRTDGYYISATGVITADTDFCCSDLIPVEKSTQYALSGIGSGTAAYRRIHAYDANGNWIEQLDSFYLTTAEYYSRAFTTKSNTVYIRISVAKNDTNIQLERGSTATTYEAFYNGGTATAEMLLKVSNYQDVQEILSGAITRNVGVKVLDGTENWLILHNDSTDTFTTRILDMLSGEYQDGVCSHFRKLTTVPASGTSGIRFGAGNDYIYIRWRLGESPYQTVAAFKQFLADQYNAGTPVIIVYPLATPTTETVTGQPMQVQQGDNIVEITQASLDNLELEAKYQAAVSLTIQEVQDANLDPNVQVTIN